MSGISEDDGGADDNTKSDSGASATATCGEAFNSSTDQSSLKLSTGGGHVELVAPSKTEPSKRSTELPRVGSSATLRLSTTSPANAPSSMWLHSLQR